MKMLRSVKVRINPLRNAKEKSFADSLEGRLFTRVGNVNKSAPARVSAQNFAQIYVYFFGHVFPNELCKQMFFKNGLAWRGNCWALSSLGDQHDFLALLQFQTFPTLR